MKTLTGIAGPFAAALLTTATQPASAFEPAWPSQIQAQYRLAFNGLKVGNFYFNASGDGTAYKITGSTKVSAMFGMFKWVGVWEANGRLGNQTRPGFYKLDYQTKKKSGVFQLDFDGAGVKKVTRLPPSERSPEVIPVKSEHMRGVLDPMAAILTLSHGAGAGACKQTLPMFDGKQRFDLVLSPKRREPIANPGPDGATAIDVCRVRYVPIAGHKPKDFEKPWVDYAKMEIAFKLVPTAKLYVPQWVDIPTTLGSATMTAEAVTITTAGRQQIALSR